MAGALQHPKKPDHKQTMKSSEALRTSAGDSARRVLGTTGGRRLPGTSDTERALPPSVRGSAEGGRSGQCDGSETGAPALGLVGVDALVKRRELPP
jgi:hypothetical protein